MITLAALREQLVGQRVVDLRGRNDDGAAELREIVFEDGTVLRFNWWVGSSDEFVGLAVRRARPEPTRRSTGLFRVT